MTPLQRIRPMRRIGVALATVATAVALTACGGGDDDGDRARNGNNGGGSGVPNSATDSVAGLMAYMVALIASSSDTAEPVVLGDAKLPTSETSETVAN